MPIFIVVPPKG